MRTKCQARRMLVLLAGAMFIVWSFLLYAVIAATELHPAGGFLVFGAYIIGSVNDEIRRYVNDERILEDAEIGGQRNSNDE